MSLHLSHITVRPRPAKFHRGAQTVGFEGVDEPAEANHPDSRGARGSLWTMEDTQRDWRCQYDCHLTSHIFYLFSSQIHGAPVQRDSNYIVLRHFRSAGGNKGKQKKQKAWKKLKFHLILVTEKRKQRRSYTEAFFFMISGYFIVFLCEQTKITH